MLLVQGQHSWHVRRPVVSFGQHDLPGISGELSTSALALKVGISLLLLLQPRGSSHEPSAEAILQ